MGQEKWGRKNGVGNGLGSRGHSTAGVDARVSPKNQIILKNELFKLFNNPQKKLFRDFAIFGIQFSEGKSEIGMLNFFCEKLKSECRREN
jgi:hypothetical protein